MRAGAAPVVGAAPGRDVPVGGGRSAAASYREAPRTERRGPYVRAAAEPPSDELPQPAEPPAAGGQLADHRAAARTGRRAPAPARAAGGRPQQERQQREAARPARTRRTRRPAASRGEGRSPGRSRVPPGRAPPAPAPDRGQLLRHLPRQLGLHPARDVERASSSNLRRVAAQLEPLHRQLRLHELALGGDGGVLPRRHREGPRGEPGQSGQTTAWCRRPADHTGHQREVRDQPVHGAKMAGRSHPPVTSRWVWLSRWASCSVAFASKTAMVCVPPSRGWAAPVPYGADGPSRCRKYARGIVRPPARKAVLTAGQRGTDRTSGTAR